jgi:hypothetical protein
MHLALENCLQNDIENNKDEISKMINESNCAN